MIKLKWLGDFELRLLQITQPKVALHHIRDHTPILFRNINISINTTNLFTLYLNKTRPHKDLGLMLETLALTLALPKNYLRRTWTNAKSASHIP